MLSVAQSVLFATDLFFGQCFKDSGDKDFTRNLHFEKLFLDSVFSQSESLATDLFFGQCFKDSGKWILLKLHSKILIINNLVKIQAKIFAIDLFSVIDSKK